MTIKRKKRKAGQKDPLFDTKSSIIVFIAEKENVTIADIREYLRNEKNIKNIKNIRNHIKDLVDKNIIKVKKSEKRGMNDFYYIDKTFSSFKNSFNFITDFYKITFLESKYAKEVIFDEKFFVSGIVNIIKESYKETFKYLENLIYNNEQEEMSYEYDDKSDEDDVPYENDRSDKYNKPNYRKISEEEKKLINELKDDLTNINFDEIKNEMDKINLDLEEILSNNHDNIFQKFIYLLFPESQRREMLNIISTSPEAMNFFLNLKMINKPYLLANIFRFYLSSIISDRNKLPILDKISKKDPEVQNDPENYIKTLFDTSKVINDNPILTILKSFFIVDSFNDNIVKNDYSKSVLMNILFPKVKQ